MYGKNKVEVAIDRVKSVEPVEGFYVAISGGKDSDVIKALCDMAGVKYDLHHQHTTADAPQTVRYIRETYLECKIDYPEKSIWQLIIENGTPPTRLMRYCCKVLKEYGGEGRRKVLGIRWSESSNRKNKRRMNEMCLKNMTYTLNPIIDWTEKEVWEFHKCFNLQHNPLYDEGCKRVGCIMCPQKGKKGMLQDAKKFPKYYENYLRTFDKMLKRRAEKGLKTTWKSPEEVMQWWLDISK